MTREEVITALIDQAFDSPDMAMELEQVLRIGCVGFENMTNQELEDIYNEGLEEDEKVRITE